MILLTRITSKIIKLVPNVRSPNSSSNYVCEFRLFHFILVNIDAISVFEPK